MTELNQLLQKRIHRTQCENSGDFQRQQQFINGLQNKLELLVDECSNVKIELDEINANLTDLYKLFQGRVDEIKNHNKETMQELAVLRERRRAFELKVGDYKSSVLMIVFCFMGIRWILGGRGGFLRLQMALEKAFIG